MMTTRAQDFLRYLIQRLEINTVSIEDWLTEVADTEIESALDAAHADGIIPSLLAGAIEDQLKDRVHQGIAKWISTLTS